jgi:hypothetical protein
MKHSDVVTKLRDAQGTQRDMRSAVREAHNFVDKRDGQWEPDVINKMRGKPRYTDDRTNPIVNQIVGELKNAEFSIKIRPAGGDATKQLADIRNGIIRNIRNMSNADAIFEQAGRKVVKGGFAAWQITHDYYDDDSFDQDLFIEPIHDAQDRVWLDTGDLTENGSDAKWGMVLHYVTKDDYAEMFPKGSGKSLGTDQWSSAYYYKPDAITIGHYFYLKEETVTLLQMSDGKVLKATEEVESILDELAEQGINIEDSREVNQKVCYFRMLDAGGWLSEPERTVFDCVPIVPAYGNFEVVEGKIIYRGVVEKMMDMQRVHNYAVSRNVEEVALAPRKKIFMTPAQAKGHEESIRTMNTNMNPVQFYNAQGNLPPPYEGGANSPNMALQTLVESSDQSISRSAGLFAANMGDNTNLQSGIALETQIDRGNNGTSIYFSAMETAICRTGVILNKAIPKVYDATRQVRILREDNQVEVLLMNNVVLDQQSGEEVTLNDLTIGKYDVVCDIGKSYKNRQQEAADMFLKAAERDPSLLQIAGDLWLSNVNAVGFDKIAERTRAMALKNGVIPEEQLTEEEKAYIQQQQAQPQQPDPAQIALEIEQMKAQTAMMVQQNMQVQHQLEMQKLQFDAQGEQQKLQSKLAVDSAKINQTQERIELEGARVQLEAQRDDFKRMTDMMGAQTKQMSTFARALVDIKTAIGADVIVNKDATDAYGNVAGKLAEESD